MTDFSLIRRSVQIEEVAKWLGIEVRGGKARCPFHNDQTPSLSFKDGRFKCFGCNESGDAIDLVAKIRHISTVEAAQLIGETFHLSATTPVQREATPDHTLLSEYIQSAIEAFAISPRAQMYLQSRGFTGESMLRFRFGYDAKRDAIVIPYGERSEYYTSRSISGKRFFKPRSEDVGPEPLFYEESLVQEGPVLVVESAFCALSILQEGGYAVAVCGTGTRKLIDALRARENVPPLIVCMDRDDAGEAAAEKLCAQLEAMGISHIRLTTPEGYKDPNELLVGDRELFRKWLAECVKQAGNLSSAERCSPERPECGNTLFAHNAPGAQSALSEYGHRKQQAVFGLLQSGCALCAGAKALVHLRGKTLGTRRRWVEGDGTVQNARRRADGVRAEYRRRTSAKRVYRSM